MGFQVLFLVIVCALHQLSASRTQYIVGGSDSTPGRWPWQASLQRWSYMGYVQHHCGAAIISDTWLLTAAHCVVRIRDEWDMEDYSVVLGLYDKDTKELGDPKTYAISEVVKFPGYEQHSWGSIHDVALVKLAGKAELDGHYAEAIELTTSDDGDLVDNQNCWITGWGKLSEDEKGPNNLQEAKVDVYSRDYCEKIYPNAGISDYHICVGKKGVSMACQGDSGGPLSCIVNGTWKLAGSTSWGNPRCDTQWPSVYSRTSLYRNWINEVTGV